MAILDMIEAYMRANELESLDGVLLVLDIRNPRWGLGAQVVQKIFEKCFKGTQKWDSIIIVGSHRDKAEEGDEDNFMTMVQWFFQEAPESRRLSTFVTKKDASGIWDQLAQVPDAGISVQANKEDLNQALSKVFSDDDPKLKIAKDKVKRLDEQIAQCKLHIKDAGRKHRIACAVQVSSQFANFASLGVKGLVRGMNRDDLDKTLQQRDELLKSQEAAREDFERSKGLFEAKIEDLRKKKCRLFTLCFPCTSADDQKHGSDEDIESSLCEVDLAGIMGCLDWCAKDMYSRLSERSRGKRAPYSEQELTKCVKGNFRRDMQERDEHWYKNPRTQFQEFLLKHAFRLPEEPPFSEAGWDGNHCERSLTAMVRDARFKTELHRLRGEATQMQKADAPLETSQLECVEGVFKPEIPSSQEVELLLHRGWSRQPFEPQRCVAELESIYKVTADDSLFTSFSCALNECGRTVSPDDLRQNVVEYIRSHLHDDLVGEIFTEEEFQRVLENMMKPGERDDDIAILAVEQKYRLPVRVWTDEQRIVQGPDGMCTIVYVQQRSNDKKHAINLLSKSVGDDDADSRCHYSFAGGTINMFQPGEMAGWEEIAPPREDSDSDDEDEDGDVLADLSNLEGDCANEESKFVKAMKKIRGAASSEMKKAFESVRLPKNVQEVLSRCLPNLPPKMDPTDFAIYCANFGFSTARKAIMPVPALLPFVPSAYPSTHGGGGGGVPAVPGAAPSVPGGAGVPSVPGVAPPMPSGAGAPSVPSLPPFIPGGAGVPSVPGLTPSMPGGAGVPSVPGLAPSMPGGAGVLSVPGLTPSMPGGAGVPSVPGLAPSMPGGAGVLSVPGLTPSMPGGAGVPSIPGLAPSMSGGAGAPSVPGLTPSVPGGAGAPSIPGLTPSMPAGSAVPSVPGVTPSVPGAAGAPSVPPSMPGGAGVPSVPDSAPSMPGGAGVPSVPGSPPNPLAPQVPTAPNSTGGAATSSAAGAGMPSASQPASAPNPGAATGAPGATGQDARWPSIQLPDPNPPKSSVGQPTHGPQNMVDIPGTSNNKDETVKGFRNRVKSWFRRNTRFASDQASAGDHRTPVGGARPEGEAGGSSSKEHSNSAVDRSGSKEASAGDHKKPEDDTRPEGEAGGSSSKEHSNSAVDRSGSKEASAGDHKKPEDDTRPEGEAGGSSSKEHSNSAVDRSGSKEGSNGALDQESLVRRKARTVSGQAGAGDYKKPEEDTKPEGEVGGRGGTDDSNSAISQKGDENETSAEIGGGAMASSSQSPTASEPAFTKKPDHIARDQADEGLSTSQASLPSEGSQVDEADIEFHVEYAKVKHTDAAGNLSGDSKDGCGASEKPNARLLLSSDLPWKEWLRIKDELSSEGSEPGGTGGSGKKYKYVNDFQKNIFDSIEPKARNRVVTDKGGQKPDQDWIKSAWDDLEKRLQGLDTDTRREKEELLKKYAARDDISFDWLWRDSKGQTKSSSKSTEDECRCPTCRTPEGKWEKRCTCKKKKTQPQAAKDTEKKECDKANKKTGIHSFSDL
eukprot:TRINITY_DN3694_c0_g1_i1.p1 TRINITY_DN3694_c0_g1~~TRINITY_DN3694_c0_g1_i1.p1  ORF type:complete len:1648 (-),score=376.13 TRINITY_DN3694_c0_g1_i1:260-4828(-)